MFETEDELARGQAGRSEAITLCRQDSRRTPLFASGGGPERVVPQKFYDRRFWLIRGVRQFSGRASKDRCRAQKRIRSRHLRLFRDTRRAHHSSLLDRAAIVPKPAEIDKRNQWGEDWKGHAKTL